MTTTILGLQCQNPHRERRDLLHTLPCCGNGIPGVHCIHRCTFLLAVEIDAEQAARWDKRREQGGTNHA